MTTAEIYDRVFAILDRTYARVPGEKSGYSYGLNSWLATALTRKIEEYNSAETSERINRLDLKHDILNYIWGNWSGGTTAEATAESIMQEFNL